MSIFIRLRPSQLKPNKNTNESLEVEAAALTIHKIVIMHII